MAEAIRALTESHGIRARKVITAVPGPAVIIKRVTLPAQSPREIENTIMFEAGNFIPEELENVNLDYQVTDYLDDGKRMEVLLVAAKKDIVASYAETLRAAGLHSGGHRRRLLRAREHVRDELRAGPRPGHRAGQHRRALLVDQHPEGRALDVHRRRAGRRPRHHRGADARPRRQRRGSRAAEDGRRPPQMCRPSRRLQSAARRPPP